MKIKGLAKINAFTASYKSNKICSATLSGLLNKSSNKRKSFYVYCESNKHLLPDSNDFKMKQINEKHDFLMKRFLVLFVF